MACMAVVEMHYTENWFVALCDPSGDVVVKVPIEPNDFGGQVAFSNVSGSFSECFLYRGDTNVSRYPFDTSVHLTHGDSLQITVKSDLLDKAKAQSATLLNCGSLLSTRQVHHRWPVK